VESGNIEKIEIIQTDITGLEVDAVVNAANRSLLGGGGVDGAIHRAAGPRLLAECKTIGGCPTGEARITRGYDLKAKYVIHTVGPVYSGTPGDSVLLNRCYRNCLDLAAKNDVKSIAFPAISCGVYGYPIEEACKIAFDAVLTFLSENVAIQKVMFVLFSGDDYKTYRDQLSLIRR
jgi:O-acetyl-ADP-ribose deacetylase (regulator of RNase III)